MPRRFASYVHVQGEDGAYHVFGPDDDIPNWAADVVGDHVWAGESDGEGSGEPPRAGAGSSKQAWVSFAAANGVQVADDDTRDDIIAKLADAGVVES